MRIFLVVTAALTLTSCSRDWFGSDEFVASLRCGMSRTEVQSVARHNGVKEPEKVWYKQSDYGKKSGADTLKPRQLTFVDLYFENEKLVAYEEGNFIAFTTGMTFKGRRQLCLSTAP